MGDAWDGIDIFSDALHKRILADVMGYDPLERANRIMMSAVGGKRAHTEITRVSGLAQPPHKLPTLEATWWLFDTEPDMDDLLDQAGDVLDKMVEKLGVHVFTNKDKKHLFLMRFEAPKWGGEFKYHERLKDMPAAILFHFLAGFALEDIEMLMVLTQYSTKKEDMRVQDGGGVVVPPIPLDFFAWPDKNKVMFNYTGVDGPHCSWFAKNLCDPAPKNPHFWVETMLGDTTADEEEQAQLTWPVPGEFVAMGVRMMPDKPWGQQETSPFMYSGNFLDTIFYTSGIVTEIIDPTDDFPWPTYKVKWRVTKDLKDGIATVRPSDFTEYMAPGGDIEVGDVVTILKDITTEKKSQLWNDDDMKNFDQDLWQLVPVTFYNDITSVDNQKK